ncbi:MAG TPA: protein rep [Terriglobia bacterium]|nr:protein rep [Terriglobia bacterium]
MSDLLVISLRKIKGSSFQRMAAQVEQCHRWFIQCVCANGHKWARPDYSCKNRLCPYEMRARSTKAVHKFGAVLKALRDPRYLVLTVENCQLEMLGRAITDLFSAFERLRHSKLWANVRGAIAVLEITFNRETRTWHPHLNVIFDGHYIGKAELDAVWFRVTLKRGRITWISRANRRTIPELLKYITKLADFVDIPEAVEWFLRATRGRRFIRTYGSLYRFSFEEERETRGQGHDVCPDCGSPDVQVLSYNQPFQHVYHDDSGILRVGESVCGQGRTSGRCFT